MSTFPRRPSGPATTIHTGPTIPGWTLHAALAVAALGAVSSAAAATSLPGAFVVLVLVALLATVAHAVRRPSVLPAAAAITATGLASLVVSPAVEAWRVPVIILCVHLVVRLSWFTSSSRPGGLIEIAVLRQEGASFLVINLVGQAVGVLALVLTGARADSTLGQSGVLAVLGAAGVLGLTALLLVRSSRTA